MWDNIGEGLSVVYGDLKTVLLEVAQYLGVAADTVWEVLQKQAKVQLVHNCLWLALLIGVLIYLAVLTRKFAKKFKEAKPNSEVETFYYACSFMTEVATVFWGAFTVVVGMGKIQECIQIIVNPSLWIIQYVQKLLGA